MSQLLYYTASASEGRVRAISDNGVALTETSIVSPALSNPARLCFDDDYNIYVAGFVSGNIRVYHLDREDLSIKQISGSDYVAVSAATYSDISFSNGNVYLTYEYHAGSTSNFAIVNAETGAITRVNLGSATYNAGAMAFSRDKTVLYVRVYAAAASPRVYKLDAVTGAVLGSFGSIPDSPALPTYLGVAVMPNGAIVFGASENAGTNPFLTSFNDMSLTANWGPTASGATFVKGIVHVKDTTAVRIGGPSTAAVRAFNYLTGATVADFRIDTSGALWCDRNYWNQVVVVGGNHTDGADTANIRVLDSTLTNKRFNTIHGGGQVDRILAYSELVGYIDDAPVDNRYKRRLVAAGNNQIFYETASAAMVSVNTSPVTVLATGSIVTADPLTGCEAYGKAFFANGITGNNIARAFVCDFGNTKLYTENLGGTAFSRGDIIGRQSGGVLVSVKYVVDNVVCSSLTGSAYIFAHKITDGAISVGHTIANETGTITCTAHADEISPAASAPHFYDWRPYANFNNIAGLTNSEDAHAYGQMPNNFSLVCLYRGRLVVSGNPQYPHQWYMTRQANPWDWQYFAADAQSPVAGGNSVAGQLGDKVTCLAPYKDDYLIMGCVGSIWLMRGDPAAGGSLDVLDMTTGVFGALSFCWDATGMFYFFGTNGIYRIPPQLGPPHNMTESVIPDLIEELGVSPETHRIVMQFDRRNNGVLVAITTLATGVNKNYWLDVRTGGFFPEIYPFDCAAFSMHYYEAMSSDYRILAIGCADGYVRYFSRTQKSDIANYSIEEAIESKAMIGPIQIGADDARGRMKSLSVTMSSDTDGAEIDIYAKETAEEVVDDVQAVATPLHTGLLPAANRVQRFRPRTRGAWMGLVLKNENLNETWSLEKAVADVKPAGGL